MNICGKSVPAGERPVKKKEEQRRGEGREREAMLRQGNNSILLDCCISRMCILPALAAAEKQLMPVQGTEPSQYKASHPMHASVEGQPGQLSLVQGMKWGKGRRWGKG